MTKTIHVRALDEWYRIINRIYLDRNYYRDPFSIFAHLVEVVGGLSQLGTDKQKPHAPPLSFLPKTIAWWLALCAKLGVRSVEDMLWAKFPWMCPYCHLCPHINDRCLEIKEKQGSPDWKFLAEAGKRSPRERPRSLAAWQTMFSAIYLTPNDPSYSVPLMRFTEELGELSEALRVASIAPGYFLSEASDVFAWLMNLQNVQHSKLRLAETERGRNLCEAFWNAYPDKCNDCQNPICTCPPVLPGTLGRIAHEIPEDSLALMPGGPFLSAEEARTYFELGSSELRLGGRVLQADVGLIREIHQIVTRLRFFAVENAVVSSAHSGSLARAIAEVERLATSQRVTQTSLDELTIAISNLPSDGQNAIMNFLSGLSSSVWASALLQFFQQR